MSDTIVMVSLHLVMIYSYIVFGTGRTLFTKQPLDIF